MPVTASDIRGLRYNKRHGHLLPSDCEGWENFQTTLVSWVPESEAIMDFEHEDTHISLRKNGVVYLVVKSDCDHHNASIYAHADQFNATRDYMSVLDSYLVKHAIAVSKAEPPSPSTETVTCFITGKTIPSADAHDWRFTYEFDAYVSPEGQRLVANCPNVNPNDDAEPPAAELEIIYREWRA